MKMAGLESMAMVVEEVKPVEKPVDREKVLIFCIYFIYFFYLLLPCSRFISSIVRICTFINYIRTFNNSILF